MSVKVGGFTGDKDKDTEVQEIIEKVRGDVEAKLGQLEQYVAIKYQTQVVAGTNYLVKVQVGPDAYIHLKVFKPLPHTQEPPQLSNVEDKKTLSDEL